ncbi:sensor domain-containing diguanylate cyclase [Actinoplanes siamensis]|uniref:GGDEF domain-containing protein n=1 Tax=Actinoplanes siamensis TaxID=1223317 RepID=A0A919TPL9_9ACTN|nr:GGDEF domain-containing protein [Actinoplanes siamensis]GIF09922.1 hypothetical protein Asi03nite_74600 [Actinoplanes siamensis]
MRNMLLAMLAGALVFLAGGSGSAVASRSEAINTEQATLSRRSAIAAQLVGHTFTRASSIIQVAARDSSYLEFYGSRADTSPSAEERYAAVERVTDQLVHLGRMYSEGIGEASFIDISGHENVRVVNGRSATSGELADDRRSGAYFGPTFALSPGVVYQSVPYRSAATGEWVISSGTQVLTPDWIKRAIVHFELPVESFRREIESMGDGHLVIVDAGSGRVVIDTTRVQGGDEPLGNPDNHLLNPLVRQWGEHGLVRIDGRLAAYQRIPADVGNANSWYAVTFAPAPTGPLTGVGWLPSAVILTSLLLITYTLFALVRGESALRTAANTDPLTGLRNRRSLADDVRRRIGRATSDNPVLLILSDLNGFKAYNDTLGHPAGDALLLRLAAALTGALAGRGTAYRIGGDEFCVVAQPGATGMDELMDVVDQALRADADLVPVCASHGLVVLPDEAADFSTAMKLVDERMYEQKRASRQARSGGGQPTGA